MPREVSNGRGSKGTRKTCGRSPIHRTADSFPAVPTRPSVSGTPISGNCLHTFKASNVVYAVAVSPDGKTVASAGRHPTAVSVDEDAYGHYSNTVQLWNPETLQSITDLGWWMEFAPASIWSLAFSADGKYLAAASRVQSNSIIPDGGGGHWWCLGSEFYGYFPEHNAYAVGFARKGSAVAVTHKNTVTVYPKPGEKEAGKLSHPGRVVARSRFCN